MIFQLACCERLLLEEIANKEFKRRDVAQTYRLALSQNCEKIDWQKVNQAIIARWSFSGLNWIKNQAHSGKCFDDKPKETP